MRMADERWNGVRGRVAQAMRSSHSPARMIGRFVPTHIKAEPRVWQVCFAKRTRTWWADSFLPAGFRHVYLIGYVPEFDTYVMFDPASDGTQVSILSPGMAGRYLARAIDEGAVLNFAARTIYPRVRFWHRLGFWCVPAVKHILGLGCVAMTPHRLHSYLLTLGAQPFVEDDDGKHIRIGPAAGIESIEACA